LTVAPNDATVHSTLGYIDNPRVNPHHFIPNMNEGES